MHSGEHKIWRFRETCYVRCERPRNLQWPLTYSACLRASCSFVANSGVPWPHYRTFVTICIFLLRFTIGRIIVTDLALRWAQLLTWHLCAGSDVVLKLLKLILVAKYFPTNWTHSWTQNEAIKSGRICHLHSVFRVTRSRAECYCCECREHT
jgi:hypothetical protein